MGTCSSLRRRMMMGGGEVTLPNYLCFTALEDGTFTLTIGSDVRTSDYSYIEYSIDEGNTWVRTNNVNSETVEVTTPTIIAGNKVYWRGSGASMHRPESGSVNARTIFSSTGKYNASGLLVSLVEPKPKEDTAIIGTYTFTYLFYASTGIIDASGIIFPPNTKRSCYQSMFQDSTSIENASFIISIDEGIAQCRSMFMNCTNLISAPTIVGNAMHSRSAQQMFYGCTSLLRSANVDVSVLADYSLYYFNCNARNINYFRMLAVDISASNCTYGMMIGVQNNNGIFVKHIDATWTTTGNSGVPSNWTIIYYDPSEDKYYTSQDKSQECDDHGNPI